MNVDIDVSADAGAILGADVCALLSAVVRRTRAERSWSQRELARRAGWHPATVRRLEAGEATSLVAATDIVKALGLTLRCAVHVESPARP